MKSEKEHKNKTKTDKKTPARKKNILRLSHTKGYYRFSKDFPSVTSGGGFRDNEVFVRSDAKKASFRRRLALVFVCVFTAAFVCTLTAFTVSRYPAAVTCNEISTENEEINAFTGIRAVFLSGDTLSYSSVSGVISELKAVGANAVIIEFKDSQGYFYYTPSVSVSREALSRAADGAEKTVSLLKNEGIAVFACISCFADDIYARNNRSSAVLTLSSEESGGYGEAYALWYGGEMSNAWLSPYSDDAVYYMRSVISDIASMGVTGIILNNVLLPDAENGGVIFSDKPEEGAEVDEASADFVLYINNSVSTETGVVVSSDFLIDSFEKSEKPKIFSSGCDYIIADARESLFPEDAALNGKSYKDSPDDFISSYFSSALALLSDSESDAKIIPLISSSDAENKFLSAAADSGFNSYISQ